MASVDRELWKIYMQSFTAPNNLIKSQQSFHPRNKWYNYNYQGNCSKSNCNYLHCWSKCNYLHNSRKCIYFHPLVKCFKTNTTTVLEQSILQVYFTSLFQEPTDQVLNKKKKKACHSLILTHNFHHIWELSNSPINSSY